MQCVFTCSLARCLDRCRNSCQKLLSLHSSQIRGSHHSLRRISPEERPGKWLSERFLLKQVCTCWLTAVPGVLDTCSLFSSLALSASLHTVDLIWWSTYVSAWCRDDLQGWEETVLHLLPVSVTLLWSQILSFSEKKGRSILVIKVHPLVTQGDLD